VTPLVRLPPGRPPGAPEVPRSRHAPRRLSAAAPPRARPLPPKSPAAVAKKKRKTREETFSNQLAARLWKRSDTGNFTLDLHGERWAGIRPDWCPRYLTVRDPADEGWPQRGSTTTDPETAEDWVRSGYASWLSARAARGASRNPTVAQACETYLEDLEKTHGADHNTYVNRRSAFRCHIEPALGAIDLDALSKQTVREFLTNLQVRKFESGVPVSRPASLGTKCHVRAALLAVWHHAYPDAEGPAPFAGIRLGTKSTSRSRREAARSGVIPEQNKQERAYTPDELLLLLATAMRHDREVTSLPHLAALYLPNVAPGIAFVCGIGARIEEATFVRWRHVQEQAIYVPGTKSHNSPRSVPRQAALEPWLAMLRELAGGAPDPDDFVLRLRRDGDRGMPPSAKTWAGRIAQIEVEAGLKVPGKRAHILRATHISYAKDVLPTAALKAYAGHAQPFGGATDDYVDTRPPFIPRAHRHYLRLPTPAEVEKHARRLPARAKPDRAKRRRRQ
jgi:integrase